MKDLFGSPSEQEMFGIYAHCYDKLRPVQLERLNTLVQTRPILLNGEFYMRATSQNGIDFIFPDSTLLSEHQVIAWSRILDGKEVLCAVNLDEHHLATCYATVDNALHEVDSRMHCLFASELSPAELNVEVRNGKAIRLTIPPNALVIYG